MEESTLLSKKIKERGADDDFRSRMTKKNHPSLLGEKGLEENKMRENDTTFDF